MDAKIRWFCSCKREDCERCPCRWCWCCWPIAPRPPSPCSPPWPGRLSSCPWETRPTFSCRPAWRGLRIAGESAEKRSISVEVFKRGSSNFTEVNRSRRRPEACFGKDLWKRSMTGTFGTRHEAGPSLKLDIHFTHVSGCYQLKMWPQMFYLCSFIILPWFVRLPDIVVDRNEELSKIAFPTVNRVTSCWKLDFGFSRKHSFNEGEI